MGTKVPPGMEDPRYRRIQEALHKLWTKAVGTKGYVKAEWKELSKAIDDMQTTLEREHEADVAAVIEDLS